MADACIIGPFPVPLSPRGNKHLGGRTKAHWSGEAGLAAEQRRLIAAAFAGSCEQCGKRLQPVRLWGKHWQNALTCGHTRARIVPIRLPPHGPEHPVDVLVARVPSHGGSYLDPHDGLPHAFKAVVDEIAAQLWPIGKVPVARGRTFGKVDDSALWLRWCYGQRHHRKAKNPRRMTERPDWVPGPPDPSNRGTELCEIWIAPREDCGCGRSMLPIRWARGEL